MTDQERAVETVRALMFRELDENDRDIIAAAFAAVRAEERERADAEHRALLELEQAARAVIDQTHEMLNTHPSPQRYRAPYGALNNMTAALAAVERARKG